MTLSSDCTPSLTVVHGTSTASEQRYVYDGTNMVLAFDGSGNLTDRYLSGSGGGPGPGGRAVQPERRESAPGGQPAPRCGRWETTRIPCGDLVSDTGTLEEHIAYSPFGQQTAQTVNPVQLGVNPVDFVFGYTGSYTDPATGGLQLHGARWYDPSVGRWLSQDPSGLAGGDENLYRYCGNGPTDGTDASGLASEPVRQRPTLREKPAEVLSNGGKAIIIQCGTIWSPKGSEFNFMDCYCDAAYNGYLDVLLKTRRSS